MQLLKLRPMLPRHRLPLYIMSLVFGLGVFVFGLSDGWFADHDHLLFPVTVFIIILTVVTYFMRRGMQQPENPVKLSSNADADHKTTKQ